MSLDRSLGVIRREEPNRIFGLTMAFSRAGGLLHGSHIRSVADRTLERRHRMGTDRRNALKTERSPTTDDRGPSGVQSATAGRQGGGRRKMRTTLFSVFWAEPWRVTGSSALGLKTWIFLLLVVVSINPVRSCCITAGLVCRLGCCAGSCQASQRKRRTVGCRCISRPAAPRLAAPLPLTDLPDTVQWDGNYNIQCRVQFKPPWVGGVFVHVPTPPNDSKSQMQPGLGWDAYSIHDARPSQ
jgi:hypothetical protein